MSKAETCSHYWIKMHSGLRNDAAAGEGKGLGVQDSVAKLAEGGEVGNKCKRSYTHNQK